MISRGDMFKEITMGERVEGICKWFDEKKGFGFILWKSNDTVYDVFVHYSYIDEPGYKKLSENQAVSFEIIKSEKGLQAANVRVVR